MNKHENNEEDLWLLSSVFFSEINNFRGAIFFVDLLKTAQPWTFMPIWTCFLYRNVYSTDILGIHTFKGLGKHANEMIWVYANENKISLCQRKWNESMPTKIKWVCQHNKMSLCQHNKMSLCQRK